MNYKLVHEEPGLKVYECNSQKDYMNLKINCDIPVKSDIFIKFFTTEKYGKQIDNLIESFKLVREQTDGNVYHLRYSSPNIFLISPLDGIIHMNINKNKIIAKTLEDNILNNPDYERVNDMHIEAIGDDKEGNGANIEVYVKFKITNSVMSFFTSMYISHYIKKCVKKMKTVHFN